MKYSVQDLKKTLERRQNLYTFLGRIYEREVDDELLKELISSREVFSRYMSIDSLAQEVRDGFSDIYNFLSKLDEKNTELVKIELAVDYANLFLGILYARRKEGIIHPSESVYLTGLLYQEPAEEVENLYLDFSLVKDERFKEPEDHIALELYFMAHLCAKALRALERDNLQEVKRLLEVQKEFLEKHLLKWVPKLVQDILKYAETEFYKGIAKITNGSLETDKKLLKELLEKLENTSSNKY